MSFKKAVSLILVLTMIFTFVPSAFAIDTGTQYATSSPDGTLTATMYLEGGQLYYSVTKNGATIVDKSRLGLKTTDTDFYSGMSFVSTSTTSWNNTYSIPGGKKSVNQDNAVQREYAVSKGSAQLIIYMTVYDDGFGFRYAIPGMGEAFIQKEYTEYNFPNGTGGWGHPPVNTYEGTWQYYSPTTLDTSTISMPFLASINNNSYWALFTEANVFNADGTYCPSILTGSAGQNMRFSCGADQALYGTQIQVALPFQSPYRAVIVTDNLNDLVNSTLVQNLNPESKIADTSWIKPGISAWSWWSEDYYGDPNVPEGYREVPYSFERQKEYVDFAASMGWEYVTVDAGWVKWTDGTIEDLVQYAETKDVGIFIWASPYVHTPYGASRMNLRKWASWGIKGVKVDMTANESQVGMSFLESVADYAAELKLMVYYHNSTKPGGEERTWPNVISSEGVLGSERYKLYWPPAPTAVHNTTLPFTRNVLGSMDYTPVALSNTNKNTTQGHQLAMAVVYESKIQNYADSIDIYANWKGTELLRVVPASWDETKLLDGFPGSHAVMARKSGSDWYIGAMTVGARTITIPLSSLNLEPGDYTAYVYKDGATGESISKEISTVTASSTLTIPLLATGGAAVLISKTTVPSMPDDPYTYYEAESAALAGSASVVSCVNCSNGNKVGNLGNNSGTVEFNVTVPTAGTYKFKLNYLAADERWINYSLNGGANTLLKLRLDSGSWNVVRSYITSMNLNAGTNTIKLSYSSYAPDIDNIGILIP
ncbi:glycoside hydrolase [Paenibacillus sp. 1011MAR3C5]|uniref:glycoside hydrolase family 97 catalytic domain-containing protein n=1 Tax=Paenibacillus sp. 1011MAR3C5 TaxID=1675787 RepID=UPI000E6C98DC|nr:glycoside hydrolase family 97 catalytic domain-containing protein [Paenibacillus sp. 1011MAR3C5]RJE88718.1 glycoside hydrolase [Paenibacillus sp. 1011MAR3C5]